MARTYSLSDDHVHTEGVADAAGETLYRSERYGDYTYTVLVEVGSAYAARLHFAETKYDKPGARRFGVEINGRSVLTDFDIVAAAGGKDWAVARTFAGIAPDASGNVRIHRVRGAADEPKVCGIEILPTP